MWCCFCWPRFIKSHPVPWQNDEHLWHVCTFCCAKAVKRRNAVWVYSDRDSVISGLCCASVQIVRLDRTMEQIVFPVPNICEFLTQESKLRVYYSTERDEQGSKINDFFLSSEDLFNEMNWQKKLRGTQEATANTNTVPCTSFYSTLYLLVLSLWASLVPSLQGPSLTRKKSLLRL